MNARSGLALGLAVLIAGSGCAYFNTFYNAKSEFRRAETDRKASLSGSGGGEGGYQKCIEKCQSLLRYYPKSKYIDDALFLIGMSRLYRTEYIQSRASLEDLVERFPKSSYVEPALYWMGVAALKQGDAAGAAQAFGKLAEKFPESKLNVEAVFRQQLLGGGHVERGGIRRKDFDGIEAQRRRLRAGILEPIPKDEGPAFGLGNEGDSDRGAHEGRASKPQTASAANRINLRFALADDAEADVVREVIRLIEMPRAGPQA